MCSSISEAVREGFGEVFPPLPEDLVSSIDSPERWGGNGHPYGTKGKSGSGRRDLKPPVNTRSEQDLPLVPHAAPGSGWANPERNPGDAFASGASRAEPAPTFAAGAGNGITLDNADD